MATTAEDENDYYNGLYWDYQLDQAEYDQSEVADEGAKDDEMDDDADDSHPATQPMDSAWQ